MSFKKWPAKDPDAVKDYGFDWAHDDDGSPGLFAEDTITSSEWIVPDGIIKDSDTFTSGGLTTIWISGGSDKVNYTLTNRVTTVGGRTDDRSVVLPVRTQ